MPPKRKRVPTKSPTKEERAPKKLKVDPQGKETLQTIPDDCLSEIFSYLPSMSLCAASLTSKRFNNVYESLILKDLSKILETTKSITIPKSIKDIFYPIGHYLAFEKAICMVDQNDDNEGLEKLLSQLNNHFTLKISEKVNSKTLKDQLSEEVLKAIHGKVAYKEISPVNSYALWEYSDSNTNGGKFHVSFYLFGQKEHYAYISCEVFSFYESSGGTFTCDLTLNAKLMSYGSKKSTDVNELLEGYKEATEPEFYSEDEEEDAEFDDEDSDDQFRKQVKFGDRVKREWFHDCYPTLDKKKLDQVRKWLGWEMSTLDFAKVLVGLSMKPELEGYALDIDTTNTKASLESLLKKMLSEDESQWLNEVERTLDHLFAKIKLKNRIAKEWKKKPKAKLTKINALIDQSMYSSNWSLMEGEHDPEPDLVIYYKTLRGELKLIYDDPSKWISFNFTVLLCREDKESQGDDDCIEYSISSSKVEGKMRQILWEEWTIPESEVKLIKDELGLGTFTNEEVVELLAMAADHPLKEISLRKEKKSKSK